MAEIKACLFDLDGVIVDTAKYHFKAWKRLCQELGFDLTLDQNEKLKGVSRVESLDILLADGGVKLSQADKDKYLVLKNEWYLEHVKGMNADELLPGVVYFFQLLQNSKIKIALGSASKNAMAILEMTDILKYFDAVIDGTKVLRGKPDPETFTLGAAATNCHPSECVVFEDAIAGIQAGVAGGMYTIGVGEPEVLTQANVVIPGFQGVGLDIFKRL